jgi:hypothetical protein
VNRRRIAIGVSAASGVAILAGIAAVQMSSGGAGTQRVQLAGTPTAAVRAAGPATAEAKTAQVDTIVTMRTPAVPANGATPAAAAMTTTMHGTGFFDFSRSVGQMDLSTAKGSVQEVLTPAELFVRTAPPSTASHGQTQAAAPAAAADKGWMASDIGRVFDGNLVTGGSTDPGMVFAMLGGVQPDVKLVGQEKVRDVQVAHYHGTLDLADAANALSAPSVGPSAGPAAKPSAPVDPAAAANAAADKKALTNASRAFRTTKIPFDAYLDGDGRLRRFVASFSFVVPGPNKVVAEVSSATDLFGFGIPVNVVTPSVSATSRPARAGTPTPTHSAAGTPSPSRSAHK